MRGGIGSRVGGSRTSAEDFGCPVHTNERRTHDSYAQMPRVGSKRPWPAASVGFTKARAGVGGGTCIITRLSPDRYHPLKLALSRGFRQIGDVTMDPTKRRQACWTSIPARIARSEDAGAGG